jgi:hypothetical protein
MHLVTALGVRISKSVAGGHGDVASGPSDLGYQSIRSQFCRRLLDGAANAALSPECGACSQGNPSRQPKRSFGHRCSAPTVLVLIGPGAEAPHPSCGSSPHGQNLYDRIGECPIGQARGGVDGGAHRFCRLEHGAYPLHLGGGLVYDPVGFDDQWHRLDSEILGHSLEAPDLTPETDHGQEQTDYRQNAGASGNEYGNLTSGHDPASLEGPPGPTGGRTRVASLSADPCLARAGRWSAHAV